MCSQLKSILVISDSGLYGASLRSLMRSASSSDVGGIMVGALKMLDVKMTDVKLMDQCAGHENAGHENAGHEMAMK